ncbi:DUF6086 family protein [Streptomyces sp. NPDC051315]|uniref:DUF6086 family protein n=1 Tax=Streptomyces sp. NPDC051315 TaxID=3365650 RepID=UPI00378E63B5
MSQYYEVDGETLWNPSQGASRLFLAHVRVHEEWLGVPSGLGPMEWDECQIDVAVFTTFVNALLERHSRTRHAVVNALSDGFVATVLALAARAGIDVRPPRPPAGLEGFTDVQVPSAAESDRSARLLAQAEELQRAMPR